MLARKVNGDTVYPIGTKASVVEANRHWLPRDILEEQLVGAAFEKHEIYVVIIFDIIFSEANLQDFYPIVP